MWVRVPSYGNYMKEVYDILVPKYLAVLNVEPQNCIENPTSTVHLAWMLTEIQHNDTMSDTKKNRWLGYVQGCMTCLGLLDVQTERDATRQIFNGK